MRVQKMWLYMITIAISVSACAAEPKADPTNVEELKAHYTAVAPGKDTFSADYSMEMDMAAMGQPQAGAGAMDIGGKMFVKGERMRMDMGMKMDVQGQSMDMNMKMSLGADKVMHMLIDMQGMTQAMRMDMSVMEQLAEQMGVPASALNNGNMGMGMMANPSKMLDTYAEMYALEFLGKESLNGEDVYVLNAVIRPEVLENFSKNPMLEAQKGMFDGGQKLYLGATDGVIRKMTMGDTMTMTLSNIDFDTEITDADLTVTLPAGVQEMDMTAMMQSMYGNLGASTN